MLNVISKLVSIVVITVLTGVNVTAVFAATPAQQSDQTIVDIAVADGRFTTLVAALQAAGLVDTLNGEGPFTVFAPTDDAFAKLPEGAVDALLADIPTLTNILLYHVVPGKVLAADVVNLPSADTALGQPVKISVDGSTVKVNDAQVIITDIEASNGVIHVIDTVLLPPEKANGDQMDSSQPVVVPQAYQGQRQYKRGHTGQNYRSYNRYNNRGNYNRGYYGKRSYNRGNYNRGHYSGRSYYGRGYYGGRNYQSRGYYSYRSYNRGHQGKGYYGYRGYYR